MEGLRYQIRPNIFEEYMPKMERKDWSSEYCARESSRFEKEDKKVNDKKVNYEDQQQTTNHPEVFELIDSGIKLVQNQEVDGRNDIHNKNTQETNPENIDQNVANKNKLDNEYVNKIDKNDRKRKTSVTVNGKLLFFAEQTSTNELAASSQLKCVDIDIGENNNNKQDQLKENSTQDVNKQEKYVYNQSTTSSQCEEKLNNILNKFDTFQVESNKTAETTNSSPRYSKLSQNLEETSTQAKFTPQDDHNLINSSENYFNTDFIFSNDNNLGLTTSDKKVNEKIYSQNSFNYATPQFVNLDTVKKQCCEERKSDLYNNNKDNVLEVLKHKRQSFANSTRRRSLSTGDLEFSNQLVKNNLISRSVNDLSENTFYETEILLSDDEVTSSEDDNVIEEVNTVFNRQKKKSFIGKSISVDVVNQDGGFSKRKYRRRGVFFDSKSFESNSEEDDFLTDLLEFKKKYKLKKRQKSTGLRFARSVENLLKIDRPNSNTTRKRSNTDAKEGKHTEKKKLNFLGKKFRQNKEKMEYIRETSLLDNDEGELENESGQSRPNISLVGNTVQKVAGIIEMYMDKKGDVIRKIEIHKVQGQSLGFFIRFGNGIERENGIFISRVTLGSFVDVNNVLHAGDEILTINKVDVTDLTLEEVACMMQRSESLIIKTRSALPLPMHARPLLKTYDTRFGQEEIRNTLAEHERLKNQDHSLSSHNRTHSDPLLLSESSGEEDTWRGRPRRGTNPFILDDYADDIKTELSRDHNKHEMQSGFSRKLPTTPTDESSKSFSRAQRYLNKSPTSDFEGTESPKPAKNKYLKSPKIFRKSDSKKTPFLNGASQYLSPKMDYSPSTSPSPENDTPIGKTGRTQGYANDGIVTDIKSMRSFSGRLMIHIQQLLGRLSSLDGDCYCTIEVDDEYKATTQPKPTKDVVNFDEYFEIELHNAYTMTFLIFFKQHKRQHKLLSQTCIHLQRLLTDQNKAQLLLSTTNNVQIRIGLDFTESNKYLQRSQSTRSRGVFGFNLSKTLVDEENTIPILVRKCVEEIEKRGMNLVGIYRICGNARKKKLLRMQFDEDSINANVNDPEIDCHAIAGILKDYLRELPHPLISQETYLNIYNKSLIKNEDKKLLATLMKKLPYTNRATLIYIMEHIQHVAEHSYENKMDFKNLAVCFGPVLMCPPITKGSSVADMFDFKKQIQALEFLLTIWPGKSQQNSV